MEQLAEDLRTLQRTPLDAGHVERLRALGEEIVFDAGTIIAEPGQPMDRFLYVLDGEIELLNAYTLERAVADTLGPTQFAGEIAFLAGGAYTLPNRAVRQTRVLAVPRAAMLDLMAKTPELSDHVISVFAARRRRLLSSSDTGLTLIGAEQDRNLRQIAAFADRNRIPVNSLELGSPEAAATASACGVSPDAPSVIFGRSIVVAEPTPAKIAALLGLQQKPTDASSIDVLIVGGGPAGVAAGVYAGSEGLSALVIDEFAVGGQAGTSSRIENYMGFPTGISGGDLLWRGWVQALKFGTRFAVPSRTVALAKRDDGAFLATLDDGAIICARAVVVATGVQYRRLPLPRLEDFEGAGIYYAATEAEARYCRDGVVVVVGGGNSAGQAAMYLLRVASHVHILVRGTSLADSMSEYLIDRLRSTSNIHIHCGAEIAELIGDTALEAISIRDRSAGTTSRMPCCGVFIMVGAAPNTNWLSGLVALDKNGFVLTGPAVDRVSPFATSHAGIYAVGDVRAGSVKRVASAVGEGSVVISEVWAHVRGSG